MDALDQWYYLDGSETRGPVPANQIVQLIRAGQLSPVTQVAQAGWRTWSPASVALSQFLGAAPQQGPAVPEAPTYAIRIHCVKGPDAGKAYMISAPEVSLGRVSGVGQQDPGVAENHVVLSWQNNVLYFRTLAGAKLIVAGAEVTQGTLSNGQQFQMGSSIWQVGNAPVELSNLLGNLGARLNQLTSTEKLEGFSLGEFFSEVFKGRKAGETEDYFTVGTSKTTPPLEEVQTGWPKPWFFMRVMLLLVGTSFLLYKVIDVFGLSADRALPALAVIGSLAVPLAMAFLFWELNTPRNISLPMVLVLVVLGGAVSMFVSFIGFETARLDWLKASQAGIIEETGKLAAVILVVRNNRYKYMLNGLVFGAAVGAGFAAFETAGYAMVDGFIDNSRMLLLEQMFNHLKAALQDAGSAAGAGQILVDFTRQLGAALGGDPPKWLAVAMARGDYRGFGGLVDSVYFRSLLDLVSGSHMLYTAIAACALWRVKGGQKFKLSMLFDPTFLRTFAVAVGLHMLWNSPFFEFKGLLIWMKWITLGLIGWYVVFALTQQGLRQVKDMQRAQTENEYKRTQEILTTTGRYRAQRPA
jgi:RsiW-degrading membrane proteinase PrsW (M82 family)